MSILGDARNRLAGDGVLQPQRSGGGATWESTKADAGVTRGSYTSAAACAAKGGTWIEAPGGAGYCELPKPKKRVAEVSHDSVRRRRYLKHSKKSIKRTSKKSRRYSATTSKKVI